MSTYFRSGEATQKITDRYRQKLDELPVRYELMIIETTYGNTNIAITGTENKRALVFIHGAETCAPLEFETLKELVNDFKIYAVDLPNLAGRSAEIQPNLQNNSYGKWMFEILSRLGVKHAILLAFGRGGFIALKTLAFDEKRITKTFLVAPAGIVKPSRLRYFFKVLFSVKRFRILRNEKLTTNIFRIPEISEIEAAKIQIPLYIFAAEDDEFYPANRLIKRAKKIFRSLKDVFLLYRGTTITANSVHNSSTSRNTISDTIIKNEL